MQSPDPDLKTTLDVPWLPPEALVDFFYELHRQGYKLGVQQYLDLETVLATLAEKEAFPQTLRELSAWLAPIVCTSADEQSQFFSHLEQWVSRRPDVLAPKTTEPRVVPTEKEGSTRRSGRSTFRFSKFRHVCVVVLVAAVSLISLFLGISRPIEQNPGSVRAASSPHPTPILPTEEPTPTPATLLPIGFVAPPAPSPEPVSSSTPTIDTGRSLFFLQYFKILYLAIAALPLLALGLWLFWRFYHRRLQLERLKSAQKPRLDKILVRGVKEKIFKTHALRRVARELRRHRRAGSAYLDVSSTVTQTVANAGFFTPVYALRRSSPEYLILIDRATFSDQQASLYDEIISWLKSNDIDVDKYYFNRDPRICREPGSQAQQIALQDLSARHPEHYLIIFSDGAGFINPLTGKPAAWLSSLFTWSERALLTPKPFLEWGYAEWAMSRLDFFVLPASNEGLNALVDAMNLSGLPRMVTSASLPYPDILDEKPNLWLERHEPSDRIVRRLCTQLKRYLDEKGYDLLSACAVYPTLQWDITLYLCSQLLPREDIEHTLLTLVRLPWFKHGTMPDWLRSRLISEMPAEKEKVVREKLDLMLAGFIKNPQQGFYLSLASPPTQDGSWWQRVKVEIKRRVANWSRRKSVKQFIRAESENSLSHDYVFLNFMSGNRLAVSVPAPLRRVLLRKKSNLLGSLLASRVVTNLVQWARRLLFREGVSYLGFHLATVIVLALAAAFAVGIISGIGLPDGSETIAGNSTDSLLKPIASPTPPPEFEFTPTSGERGKDATLTVSSRDCDETKLQDVSLRIPGGSGIVLRSTTTKECQLVAQISVPLQTPVGDVPMELFNQSKVLGSFNYRVTDVVPCTTGVTIECPVSVSADSEITLHANVKGVSADQKLNYQWTVPDGHIISGQGTASVKVSFATQASADPNSLPREEKSWLQKVSWSESPLFSHHPLQTSTPSPQNTTPPPKTPVRIPHTNATVRPRQPNSAFNTLATVSVGGLSPGCSDIASCQFELLPTAPPSGAWPTLQRLPFAAIAKERPIDSVCPPEGAATNDEKRMENQAKNNFLATGNPVSVTLQDFKLLQDAGDAVGKTTDRSRFRTLVRNKNERLLGEGTLVKLVAYLLDSHYTNVGAGESVNCKLPSRVDNDITISLVEASGDDPCNSIIAEISPHFRPDAWNEIVNLKINQPLRITGPLFLDDSHQPCRNGLRPNPKRISVWEIHPVYNIEVCKSDTIAGCNVNDDSVWIALSEFTSP